MQGHGPHYTAEVVDRLLVVHHADSVDHHILKDWDIHPITSLKL